jgi:hypothetical protein
MVLAVRRGSSLRRVAWRFGVSLGCVQHWVNRARGQRLDRVDFADRPSGCRTPACRTPRQIERSVLSLRRQLKQRSALGEHGAAAIHRALQGRHPTRTPSVRTIGRILQRQGALDGRRRVRRPPPPKGWYLPAVAGGQVELDSFDTITDLVIRGGRPVTVLNGISLHGKWPVSWPEAKITAKTVVQRLLSHWRAVGLPGYAKFDNDTIFQGAHPWPDSFGRVIRLCLQLGVTPVFAPPREPGFAAEIEAFNGRWQRAVWKRFIHRDRRQLQRRSQQYLVAARQQAAPGLSGAPPRRMFPGKFQVDYRRPLAGTVIFLRRTDAQGRVECLGHLWLVDRHWVHRLVRIQVDLTAGKTRIFALRRREPQSQPLLKTRAYRVPQKPFNE